ncbi:MAG TPA: hypothetical protein VFA38_11920 [Nitrospirales bacterium]|nr:hypothetical protein [Nitrospirales bacterium]
MTARLVALFLSGGAIQRSPVLIEMPRHRTLPPAWSRRYWWGWTRKEN